jgi:enamine deaminase RidA (YjgF/YER057c/UK114 family)
MRLGLSRQYDRETNDKGTSESYRPAELERIVLSSHRGADGDDTNDLLSGQVSVDAGNNVVGHGDLARQAQIALENLSKALAAAGATPGDVVRLGIYVKDYKQDQAAVISKALRHTFVAERMPTSTWLGVSSLALDEILIEIEATAVIDAEGEG